jgi:toxin ParE1/3/4
MSVPILWSRLAENDLAHIVDTISEANPKAAVRFAKAVRAAASKLAVFPEMAGLWESPDSSLDGVRVWPMTRFRRYLIFYRPTNDGVLILRVVHGARDLDKLLGGS